MQKSVLSMLSALPSAQASQKYAAALSMLREGRLSTYARGLSQKLVLYISRDT